LHNLLEFANVNVMPWTFLGCYFCHSLLEWISVSHTQTKYTCWC